MTGYEIGHRGKRKRKREEDDGKSLGAVMKEEENGGSAVDDDSADENVSDVEDDGHFPISCTSGIPQFKLLLSIFYAEKGIESGLGSSAKEKEIRWTGT